jgi:hypothetical protein
VINDLDKTLEQLLKRDLPSALAAQVTITFAAPDSQFPPDKVKLPAIDLFLYDIRENRDLRSNEWIIDRQSDGTATKRRPPARVDFAYLVTAWPSSGAPNPIEDEHRLLGEVMRVLLRHSTIPAAILQGSLQGQEPPLPTSALLPSKLQSAAEFWQALGGKPKAILNYVVTISAEVQPPIEAGPPVTDNLIKFIQVSEASG